MNNDEKITLIEKILKIQEEAEEYSKNLPLELGEFLMTNKIYDSTARINSLLEVPAFGEQLAGDLNYFMWDMPKSGGRVIRNDVEYWFNTIPEFIDYLRKVYKDEN